MQTYDLSKLKVLIVEKHVPMRVMLRQVLREFGIVEVFDAAAIGRGFELFNETSPDLVLVDWAPDFDGLQLLRAIRTDEASAFPQAPVIMVTAFNEAHHVFEALDSGMTEYLTKPFSAKMLYSRIVSVIEGVRPFVRSDEFVGPDRRRRNDNAPGDERRAA